MNQEIHDFVNGRFYVDGILHDGSRWYLGTFPSLEGVAISYVNDVFSHFTTWLRMEIFDESKKPALLVKTIINSHYVDCDRKEHIS